MEPHTKINQLRIFLKEVGEQDRCLSGKKKTSNAINITHYNKDLRHLEHFNLRNLEKVFGNDKNGGALDTTT